MKCRITITHLGYAVVFLLFYASMHLAELLCQWLSYFKHMSWPFFRYILINAIAVMYAITRVLLFNPYARPKYRKWLAQSPWQFGKPLPLGPAHLVWEDAVVLAMLGALVGFDEARSGQWWPMVVGIIVVFLTGYVLTQFVVNKSHQISSAICLFFVPLIFYPRLNLANTLIVIGAIYVVQWIAMRHNLRKFPENEPQWQQDPQTRHLREAIRKGVVE